MVVRKGTLVTMAVTGPALLLTATNPPTGRMVLEAARGTSVEWHIIEEESPEPEKNIPAGVAWLKSLGN